MMFVPVQSVHRAALAIKDQGDISQCDFEDYYHCRFGMSKDVENYWLQFDSEQYATEFLLRWM
jgi:hypothetical protein